MLNRKPTIMRDDEVAWYLRTGLPSPDGAEFGTESGHPFTEFAHRFLLWRTLPHRMLADPLGVLMRNPSSAGKVAPDNTISTLMRIADREYAGGLMVANISPIISPDPRTVTYRHLAFSDDVFRWNEGNFDAVRRVCRASPRVLIAWGAIPKFMQRHARMLLDVALCEGCNVYRLGPPTKGGHPHHPLRLPSSIDLQIVHDADAEPRG